MKVRVLIYCRISADPTGKAAGVQRQEDEARLLAASLGWDIVDVLVDNDISAYGGKPRPAYRQMLDDLRAGRADAVIAWHPDRLYRRLAELEEFIDVVNGHKIAIRTVKAGEMDLSTPTGRAMARTAAVWSGHEVEHAVERMKSAKQQAAAAGEWRGGPRPFGYEADGVTVRESEARELRDAVRRLLAGEAVGSIVADWNRRGIPTPRGGATWQLRSLKHVLVRARNAGKIESIPPGKRWGETVSDAVWPAIIDPHELDAIRTLLSDPARKLNGDYRGGRRHLGSGLYLCGICEDGTTMKRGGSGGTTHQRRGVDPGVYQCRRFGHCSRSLQPVDLYVASVMKEILARPETRLRMYDVPETDVAALQTEATSIERDIEALRVALGQRDIALRDFQVAKAGMKTDLERINSQLRTSASRSPLAGIADADDVEQAWEDATLGRKRAVIEVLSTVMLLPGRPGRLPGGAYFDPDSVVIDPV